MKKIILMLIILLIIFSSTAYGESLFNPNTNRKTSLFADPSSRASQVGDIITILIETKTNINSTNVYKDQRSSDTESSFIPLNLTGTSDFIPLALSGSMSTDSTETGQRQFNLTTTLSATVQEILPNGYFVILGEQEIMVGDKNQLLQFSGVVRPGDITQDNTIYSYQIAGVSLNIQGELGEIEEKKGIIKRVLQWLF